MEELAKLKDERRDAGIKPEEMHGVHKRKGHGYKGGRKIIRSSRAAVPAGASMEA